MKQSLWRVVSALPAMLAFASVAALAAGDEPPAPIRALERHGATILGPIEAPEGMRGYAARIDGRGLAAYVLPDGRHAIIGTLINERAEDLTEAPLNEQLQRPLPPELWDQLSETTFIQDGRPEAERVVYVFTDPECPFCNMFWHSARPWVLDGRVQLRHIMVGVLGEDSPGKAAALLAAEHPEEALKKHSERGRNSDLAPLAPLPEALRRQLARNAALMAGLGSMSTPTLLYRDEAGQVRMKLGVPRDEELLEVMGGAL